MNYYVTTLDEMEIMEEHDEVARFRSDVRRMRQALDEGEEEGRLAPLGPSAHTRTERIRAMFDRTDGELAGTMFALRERVDRRPVGGSEFFTRVREAWPGEIPPDDALPG